MQTVDAFWNDRVSFTLELSIQYKIALLTCIRGIAIPWVTSFISVTRYVVSTKLVPPKNKTILVWFSIALIGIFGSIGLLITLQLTCDSVELKTFCGIIHASTNTEPPDLSKLEWATSLLPLLLIISGVCVGFVSDLRMKWFVDKLIQNQANLGNHNSGNTSLI